MVQENLIQASRGELKVDLLLCNVKLINLFSCEIIKTDIAIYDGKVVGFGEYDSRKSENLNGSYAAPGFIDGHVHIESSMLIPSEFARAVVPLGTTTIVADPHEIVNVLGVDGLKFMIEMSENLPLDIYFTVPSCVPATNLETSGALINSEDIKKWIDHPRILGLGEMMNFPGVIHREPEVLRKISIVREKPVDGHAPLLSGRDLSAYIIAGIGSDHESSNKEEALEKIRKGMFVMIREGSAARNMKTLLPLVSQSNSRFFGFVTDDRHPDFLMDFGHINSMVKEAIKSGLDPINVFQMASLNTAKYFGLKNVGAIAPGYRADIVIFDDFENLRIKKVYKEGKLVAKNGELLTPLKMGISYPQNSVNIPPITEKSLKVEAQGDRINVIEVIENQIITKKKIYDATIVDNEVVSDLKRDILKVVVIERHNATGNIGIGFVKGFSLKAGSIASTVAHDSHNLIIIGLDDASIFTAIKVIKELGGGLAVIHNGEVKASLALPIAGLLSEKPLIDVRNSYDKLKSEASHLGCKLEDPFMTLSFLALPVIPELKITDKGLVDVNKFEFIPLFAE
jgi:adenine deaminase